MRSASCLVALGGRAHDHERLLAERHDRDEIVHRVVGQLGIERVRAGERAVDQDGVAVGRRLRHHVGADRAAGARPVLDHHGLAELLSDLLHHDARDDVARAARAERHDRRDGLGRPILRGSDCGNAIANDASNRAMLRWIMAFPSDFRRLSVSSVGSGNLPRCRCQGMIPKSMSSTPIGDGGRFPACAKPLHRPRVWIDASAGEGRSEKIMPQTKRA